MPINAEVCIKNISEAKYIQCCCFIGSTFGYFLKFNVTLYINRIFHIYTECTCTQLLEHRMFRKHYGQLTDCLSQADILPYLIAAGFLTPVDQEEIDGASTTTRKAQIVRMKIASTLNALPFNKLIKVMKCHGNRALQKLAFTMENDISISTRSNCKILV